jgi:actin-like ATPase involved in cell morphogenesis
VAYDLGVDLGTTYTCVAKSENGRIDLVQLGHTTPLVQSVVSLRDDGEFVVGEAAARRSVTDPSHTVREFKRRLGDEAPYVISGKPYGAEVLASELLRRVVAQVEEAEGEPARRIALTHPANYGPFKLGKLREAATLAGVEDPLLVPEPVAAALAYAQRETIPTGGHLLVYDLGGGTFDVAVVELSADGPIVVGTPDGLERLGGIDFDAAVLNHVDRALDGRVHAADSDDNDTRAALVRLRDECRSAKEVLSSDTETEIPVLLPDLHETVRLTRAELEQMLRPRLDDTFPIVDRVVASAGITMADIAVILTVGGSSRIPLVAQLLRERTQRPVAVDPNPKASVAIGAAAVAAHDSLPAAVVADDVQPDGDATGEVAAVGAGAAAGAAALAGAGAAGVGDGGGADGDGPGSGDGARADEGAGDDDGDGEHPRRRRRVLVAALIVLLLVVGGVAAAVAMGGGGGSGDEKDAALTRRRTTTTVKRTTTTSSTTTTTTTTPATGGGGGGGGTGTNNGGNTGTRTQTTTAPTTAPLAPAPSIDASFSGDAQCPAGVTNTSVTLSWSTSNATSVNVDGYGTQGPNGSLSVAVNCSAVGGNGSVGLLAQGPGGRAGTTAYFAVNRPSQ